MSNKLISKSSYQPATNDPDGEEVDLSVREGADQTTKLLSNQNKVHPVNAASELANDIFGNNRIEEDTQTEHSKKPPTSTTAKTTKQNFFKSKYDGWEEPVLKVVQEPEPRGDEDSSSSSDTVDSEDERYAKLNEETKMEKRRRLIKKIQIQHDENNAAKLHQEKNTPNVKLIITFWK